MFPRGRMGFIGTFVDFILHIDKYLNTIIQSYGSLTYGILFAVVFLETGLVVTPFLPGDSLLFVTGVFAAQDSLNLLLVLVLLSVAAIAGDTANYWAGHHAGLRVFSRFIRQEHLDATKRFYEKHGKKTIVLARFVPMVRTLAPFVAGMGAMNYPTFLFYNVVGGLAWVFIFVFGGYFFGNIPLVKENLTFVILIIVFLSFIPGVVEYLRHRNSKKKEEEKQ